MSVTVDQPTYLSRLFAPWKDHSATLQDAIAGHVAPHFLRLSFKHPAAFARMHGVVPGTPPYTALWDEAVRAAKAAILAAYDPEDYLYSIVAGRPGGPAVAVATALLVRGRGTRLLPTTIGDPTSSLPTHRILRGFAYPRKLRFARRASEGQTWEIGRMCVGDAGDLARLLADGQLTPYDADYLRTHARAELLARTYLGGRLLAGQPKAILYNCRPLLAAAATRWGLLGHPLYVRSGAEPVPRRGTPSLLGKYFDWHEQLEAVVPADICRHGVAAAIHHLAVNEPRVLRRLGFSLPYVAPNDVALERAMGELAARLGLGPLRDAELEPEAAD